jgi:hypothetical protein
MATGEVLDVDLLDPSRYRNGIPHELYAELREVDRFSGTRGRMCPRTGATLSSGRTRPSGGGTGESRLGNVLRALKVMIGALLRRFDVIEITGEPTWMSAGPAAIVGVAVQSLPVRLA